MFRSQYRKLKELGSGSFGSAFLVQRRDDKDVYHVAKSVRLGHLSEREQAKALEEAQHLERLSHPNVVGYVATFLEERRLYIVMEYADMGDLAGKIRRRRDDGRTFSESAVMRYFVQLAAALEHIHSHSILHRDLKPQNIFLSGPNEEVKLGDFGVSRVIDSHTQGAETQIGTPHYLPPEVISGERYGTGSDLWSLGVVLYELMALRVPFAASSLPGVAVQICSAEPKALPEDYSRSLRHTVTSLLQKEPQRRPTLRELLRSPSAQGGGGDWAGAVRRAQRQLREAAASGDRPGSSSSSSSAAAEGDNGRVEAGSLSTASRRRGHEPQVDRCREDAKRPAATSVAQRRPPTPQTARTNVQVPASELAALAALERARLEAVEDRRLARQRALEHRSFNDDLGSEAGISDVSSSTASRPSSSAVAAGGGRGARAYDDHLHMLARASREAADERAQRITRGTMSSPASSVAGRDHGGAAGLPRRGAAVADMPRPQSRRGNLGEAASEVERRQWAELSRASHDAAAERQRLRAKFEDCQPAWACNDRSDRLVLCA